MAIRSSYCFFFGCIGHFRLLFICNADSVNDVCGAKAKLRVMVEGQDLEAIHRCADRIVEKINKRILKQ